MFHVGHLNILKSAKAHCDYLIVGVSTDELVQAYKNKSPVIPQADRAEIVGAIKYVDEVVFQTSRDKLAAYHQYKFDTMFVGDDWKGKPLFQEVEEKLKSFGSKVHYFPYTQHVSSSKLTEALKQVELNTNGV